MATSPSHWRSGSSLVELSAVITVVSLLLTAGIRVVGSTGDQARATATDTFMGMVEQARATAITSRAIVVLAIAEPGDPPNNDGRCLLGLFKIREWPADSTVLNGTLIRRWQALPDGTVIMPGPVDGRRNPRDEPETIIRYFVGGQLIQGRFHLLAFTAWGGLYWPQGSDPMVVRIATGSYRNGRPSPNIHNPGHWSCLTIGRVAARPYRTD